MRCSKVQDIGISLMNEKKKDFTCPVFDAMAARTVLPCLADYTVKVHKSVFTDLHSDRYTMERNAALLQ